MIWTYKNLRVCRLTDEQKSRTCGYRYTVTSENTALTAFRTREHLDAWLALLGLTLEQPIPGQDDGPDAHGSSRIIGTYRRRGCLSDADQAAFWAARGVEIRCMDNADCTLGKVTADADGVRTVWHLNPNVRDRPVFNYRESCALEDRGVLDAVPHDHWHTQGGAGWLLYDGRQVIWEANGLSELMAWARQRGIVSEHRPLRVINAG